ncbi:hypothetical protein QA640_17795 [Bradyrhizobium sp. CB82]|uniref:hypothetical protein n=1 Tax=Bradyrhizobium sp. CB82 TaxID=3039159 RepID=UPI0024B05348|nr:hypothetical protein [Bradyrhizobium sp. CB82]WFU44136.1 hypothetical protein QA640_17795 [Bradyrhizobium sp. CB82]
MYKGINRFLTRIKTSVADFAKLVRHSSFKQKTPPTRDTANGAPGWSTQISKSFRLRPRVAASSQVIQDDQIPAIGFLKEHRIALYIGESSESAWSFVREASGAILARPDLHNGKCSAIAKHLNSLGIAMPRTGKWDDSLVYHFTRHYMSIRPGFF